VYKDAGRKLRAMADEKELPMRQAITLMFLFCAGAISGCATETGTQPQEAREAPAYRTGSIIPRNRDPSDVQVVDPQAVKDAMGGKPPGQPSARP
jgi:hypothetical protein